MNEDYSGQAKRTRKYWIMGVSAGVVFILLIGSFFIWIFLPISIQSPILCFAFPLSDIIPYRAVLSHFFF